MIQYDRITPIKEQGMYFNAEMIKRIKESLQQAQNVEYTEVSTSDGIKELLGL